MAHPANRPIDFAPAWLKLPEQAQVQKRQALESNQSQRSSNALAHHITNGFQSHNNHQSNSHYNYPNHLSSSGDRYSSHHHHHHAHQSYPSSTAAPPSSSRHGRPSLSSYSGRSSSQPGLLQRSQSTGSYTDNGHRSAVGPSTVPVSDPLEEDFPLLSGGPTSTPSHKNLAASSTAQWRVKPAVGDQQRSKDDSSTDCQNDDKKLLTSKLPGKVYRAQVRTVRRSNMIPISNGRNPGPRPDQNGGEHDHSSLSSSVEKEKRLLQEMGWKEDDSEDDCVIPEQDPEQLQEIMMQAKAARERLLMKSKSRKPIAAVSSVLPDEDELPSSSDNSDAE